MEELFDSLKNWGCDVDGALARFIGDRELYRRCLYTAATDQNFELLPENNNDCRQRWNGVSRDGEV